MLNCQLKYLQLNVLLKQSKTLITCSKFVPFSSLLWCILQMQQAIGSNLWEMAALYATYIYIHTTSVWNMSRWYFRFMQIHWLLFERYSCVFVQDELIDTSWLKATQDVIKIREIIRKLFSRVVLIKKWYRFEFL